jgi:hypothetical protein
MGRAHIDILYTLDSQNYWKNVLLEFERLSTIERRSRNPKMRVRIPLETK